MQKIWKGALHILVGFGGLLLIWQLVASFAGFNPALFPSPWQALLGLGELAGNGTLWIGIQDSMIRFLIGYCIAAVLAISLGLVLGWFSRAWSFVNPVVQWLRPISPIAWMPFIVLWFGIGDLPAIVIIIYAAFFPVLLTTVSAVVKVDPIYLKVAKNFGIQQPQILFKIIFPAIFPQIMNGLRLALGTAWVFLVAGEMVGAQSGLGYLIIDSRNNLRADHLMAVMIVIGIIGFLLETGIRQIERLASKNWSAAAGKGGA